MNVHPPSLSGKVAQATVLWLVVTFFSAPLWDLARMLFEAYRHGSQSGAVMESFLEPVGTFLGLMFLFALRSTDGIGSVISHYWPAFLVSSALTVFLLRRWWRPIP